ncbi:hypothetical protein PIB30_002929 [Stylosanthes scabra]|uniref:Ribonuclease H1 N-terminal domain-containing protein n=1 Tax=Stylosanthes scabra TaxID=79078 RepID=A0ABU6V1X9_9FABA|nr:hypothetical protein [Stylosanthes scabra]
MVECYVVFCGRKPGIYPSWPAAAPQVISYPCALHQRYPTMEAGLVAWNEYFGVPCETGPSDKDGAGPSVNTGDEEAPGSGSAPFINETEVDGPNGDGNHLIGNEMPRLTGAIQALEGRVSQLEMDKWEFLLNMAELVEQMSALMNPEERTE